MLLHRTITALDANNTRNRNQGGRKREREGSEEAENTRNMPTIASTSRCQLDRAGKTSIGA